MYINFDFIIIGSGPAGQRAAIQAAKLGKRAAIIDARPQVGGVSIHTGTIPSKTLREAILYLSGWRQRGFYGHDYRLKQDVTISDLTQRLDITIRHEIDVIVDQLRRNSVKVITGIASFVDPNTVLVSPPDGTATEYQADVILIATGTRPRRPEAIPFDDEAIVDSDGLLNLKKIPRSLTVIGAGVIGVEYASMFHALDVKVTLVNERPTMLNFLDQDIASEFFQQMRSNGMELLPGEPILSVKREQDGSVLTKLVSDKDIRSDVVLYAAGRQGCTTALKLENAGLSPDDRRNLKVNEHYQTNVPHIYAAGDVIGFPSLASTSMEQGRHVALHAFGKNHHYSPTLFPYGIYTVPEISTIGKTEQELIEENIPYETGLARFRENARGLIQGLDTGLLKLLISKKDRHLLGVGLDLKALFVFAAGAVPSSLLPFPSEPSSDLPAPRSSPSLKLPNETWLADIIRRQARQAEIGMPKVVIYDSPDINAFATSMRRNDALVAMGTGLLRSMDSDEAEAVLGHDQSCS